MIKINPDWHTIHTIRTTRLDFSGTFLGGKQALNTCLENFTRLHNLESSLHPFLGCIDGLQEFRLTLNECILVVLEKLTVFSRVACSKQNALPPTSSPPADDNFGPRGGIVRESAIASRVPWTLAIHKPHTSRLIEIDTTGALHLLIEINLRPSLKYSAACLAFCLLRLLNPRNSLRCVR